jgi:hypothetical protein
VSTELDELHEDLWLSDYRISSDMEASKEWARAVLDAHAHALAEKLREFVGPEEHPGEQEYITRFVLGWRRAADHIDPEVDQ